MCHYEDDSGVGIVTPGEYWMLSHYGGDQHGYA